MIRRCLGAYYVAMGIVLIVGSLWLSSYAKWAMSRESHPDTAQQTSVRTFHQSQSSN